MFIKSYSNKSNILVFRQESTNDLYVENSKTKLILFSSDQYIIVMTEKYVIEI